MDFDIFMAMTAVRIIYLLPNAALSLLSVLFSAYMTIDNLVKLSPMSFVIVLINCISPLFVYLCLKPPFRRAFLRVVLRRNNAISAVAPFGSRCTHYEQCLLHKFVSWLLHFTCHDLSRHSRNGPRSSLCYKIAWIFLRTRDVQK